LLAEADADVIDVADIPMARMRMSPWAVCKLIQRSAGIETTLHFPTRGRNLLRVQRDLLAAHALDIRNVLSLWEIRPRLAIIPMPWMIMIRCPRD